MFFIAAEKCFLGGFEFVNEVGFEHGIVSRIGGDKGLLIFESGSRGWGKGGGRRFGLLVQSTEYLTHSCEMHGFMRRGWISKET